MKVRLPLIMRQRIRTASRTGRFESNLFQGYDDAGLSAVNDTQLDADCTFYCQAGILALQQQSRNYDTCKDYEKTAPASFKAEYLERAEIVRRLKWLFDMEMVCWADLDSIEVGLAPDIAEGVEEAAKIENEDPADLAGRFISWGFELVAFSNYWAERNNRGDMAQPFEEAESKFAKYVNDQILASIST